MEAIAGVPDPLTSDAARSGLGRLRKSHGCVPSCRRIPDSTLVLRTLLEERGQDGAGNGHRGTLWWPAMTAEFSFAWKDGLSGMASTA